MMGEDAYRSRARQLGAVSLLLFAIGVLVLAVGAVVRGPRPSTSQRC